MSGLVAPCDVCWLLDQDGTLKPVRYCGTCDAWLCDTCRASWWRRTRATVARAIGVQWG